MGVPVGASAVVAHNDLLALGALARLAARGVRVPDDVSVVGFDDVFGADFCSPPLTTLAERSEAAGARAVQALFPAIPRGTGGPGGVGGSGVVEAQRAVMLPTHLVVRASTGPAPAAPRPGGPRQTPRSP